MCVMNCLWTSTCVTCTCSQFQQVKQVVSNPYFPVKPLEVTITSFFLCKLGVWWELPSGLVYRYQGFPNQWQRMEEQENGHSESQFQNAFLASSLPVKKTWVGPETELCLLRNDVLKLPHFGLLVSDVKPPLFCLNNHWSEPKTFCLQLKWDKSSPR